MPTPRPESSPKVEQDPTRAIASTEIQQLIAVLQEKEWRRTGQRPDSLVVLRNALKALHHTQVTQGQQAAVVAALLKFGVTLSKETQLSADLRADAFVKSNGFAFLLAVIFDGMMNAERAWKAPYELKRRLGHLDPARIATNPRAVAKAIKARPSLGRFVNQSSAWVVSAARRVLKQYGGRAESIWEKSPSAKDLYARFDEFDGIAQKKAAMAVEILERLLRVSVVNMEGSDIAYDRHVRRVFLRTGLATYDDPDHMIAVARQLNATRPGAIDNPAWHVGKDWCRPTKPDCANCPLRDPCPKLIDRAASVR
jgi:uncharacterized HhH-GPD family protein